MAEKMSRKELKQPDTFQKVGGEARDWLAERQRLFALSVAAVLAVGLLIALVSYFSSRSQDRAQGGLGEALAPLLKPVEGAGTPPPGETPFKSVRDQEAALQGKLTEFKKVHGEGKAGATATFALGHTELRLGNPDAAIPYFDTFAKQAPKEDPLVASALEGKGYALEAKGDWEGALAAFDELARRNTSEFLKGMGLYHRGRILLIQDKKAEAAKVFQETQDAFTGTGAASLASERLTALAAQGVVPAPVAAPPAAVPSADGG